MKNILITTAILSVGLSASAVPTGVFLFECSTAGPTLSLPQSDLLSLSRSGGNLSFGEIRSARGWGILSGRYSYTANYSGVTDHRKVAIIKVDQSMIQGQNGQMTIDAQEDKQTYDCQKIIKDPNQG